MRSLRILVVEDEGLVAAGMKAQLQALGHEVVGLARDGEEAVAMAASLSPDLIFMDIRLPKLDGLEAARRILQERRLPIIFISAYSEADLAREVGEIGGFSYLVKPVDWKDLMPAIEVALARFNEIQALNKEVRALQEAMKARKRIEQAKGILMKRLQLSEQEAMRRLQQRSRRERRSLEELAAEVIAADTYFATWEEEERRNPRRAG